MLTNYNEYAIMANAEKQHWWYRYLHWKTQSVIEKHFKKNIFNLSIVDAGCGTGGLVNYLKNHGFNNIKAFDKSDYAIEFCKQNNLDAFNGDLLNIDIYFQASSADVIISNDTFYFLNEEQQIICLQKIFQILKQNGIFIANVPALNIFRGIHDMSVGIKKRFNKKQVKKLIKTSGFQIIKIEFWSLLLSIPILFVRLWQRFQLKFKKNIIIKSDISLPPRFINQLLLIMLKFEHYCIPFKPWGSSIFLVLKKKEI